MAATIKTRFGHEENFSRHLLESGQFAQLLARAGFTVAGEGVLELPVAKGHEGREGRLDIYQPTTAGVVIGEMQYGTSDSNHRNRFDGYAKSVANPAAIVWVAEQFRDKDLQAVAMSKVPVICVQVKQTACNNIVLTAIGGARLSAQSLEKRVAKVNADAWKWVKQVDWVDALCKDFWDDGIHPDALALRLARDSEQWVASTMSRLHVLAHTEMAVRKRSELIDSCGDAEQIKGFVASFVQAAKELCEEEARAYIADHALEMQRAASAFEMRRNERNEREIEWEAEKSQQAADPCLEAVKQEALDAYCEYMDDPSLFAVVRELYLAAEKACIAAGFKWLTGMPLVCEFIPERYACGRPVG